MEFINKKRVLLVDDNPYILKVLSMMLELENLEIETANDGTEALNLIVNETKGKFDIIITDFQMPIMDGQEFAETLKKFLQDDYSVYYFTKLLIIFFKLFS